MTTEPIQEFVLINERNVSIACAVAEAWPKARQQIVENFFAGIEQLLAKELKGWKFELSDEFFTAAYPAFYLYKPVWQYHAISVECYNHGEKMIFGAWRDYKKLKNTPYLKELFAAVAVKFPSARFRNWWEAEIVMHQPASDWRTPQVLWRMHTDDAFRRDVAEQLLEVAKISEPFLDCSVTKE